MKYTLASKLANELVEAADEKILFKTIARYGRVDLLCIDELGYMQLDRRGAELLFQVLTEREEKNSVAIASNDSFPKAHMFARTCVRWRRSCMGCRGPMTAAVGRRRVSRPGGRSLAAGTSSRTVGWRPRHRTERRPGSGRQDRPACSTRSVVPDRDAVRCR